MWCALLLLGTIAGPLASTAGEADTPVSGGRNAAVGGSAEQPQSPGAYFAWALPLAQAENARYCVPVSVSLGQSALESWYGSSSLARNHNNYFGLKCKWKGSRATGCTPTYARYASALDCFLDHGQGLRTSSYYAAAWLCPQPVPFCYDPRCFITKVAEGGYAEDPNYAAKVIKIMDDNNLYQYDRCDCPPWEPASGCGVGRRCVRPDGSWDLVPPGVSTKYWLRGDLLAAYQRAAWCLCWPTGDWGGARWDTSRGGHVLGHMHFQHGAIMELTSHDKGYWAPPRTLSVCGCIFDVWQGPTGLCAQVGAPIADQGDSTALHRPLGMVEQKFEGGYITRTAADGRCQAYPYVWYAKGCPDLWWNDLGRRRLFRRWEAFLEWTVARDLPSDVDVIGTRLTPGRLAAIPRGRAIPPLIKSSALDWVYYLDFKTPQPRRHKIANPTVFTNWGFDWWEISSRPQSIVDAYPEVSALPVRPPKITIVGAPRTVAPGKAIVVKWKVSGFPGNRVDKTGVKYPFSGCNGSEKLVLGKKVGGRWEAPVPTTGMHAGQTVKWFVYAEGDGLIAEAPAVWDGQAARSTTVKGAAGSAPVLDWAGLPGDSASGVEPERGVADRTSFVFRVRYVDEDGDAAESVSVEIERDELPHVTYPMRAVSGRPATGQVYSCEATLPPGKYSYRFVAEDHDGTATGPATEWRRGPRLSGRSAAAAPSSLAVASAACVPTRGGGAQVTFTLSTAASVEVRVVNIAGRPVRALCEGRPCKTGSNALLWDGRADNGTAVPAGLYLVTITAASEQGQTAKALATVRLQR